MLTKNARLVGIVRKRHCKPDVELARNDL